MGFFLPLLPLLLISLSVADPHFTDAWGKDGHFMICSIAERNLTLRATLALRILLGPEDLAQVCSWADDEAVRRQYPQLTRLHYANTQNVCYFDYSTDCPNGECVVGAIVDYAHYLGDVYRRPAPPPGLSPREVLMFVAHFMGDVHQPLHVGFARDRGGNDIPVNWLWRSQGTTNLHKVWDTEIIRTALTSFYNNDLNYMTNSIVEKYITVKEAIHIGELKHYIYCYASESITLACDYAYRDEHNRDVEPGSTLQHEYFCSQLPIVEKRIVQAGVRLAALLNEIFRD